MANRNRIVLWIILSLVLVVALAFAFWPRAILVDIAIVSRGEMSVTIDEEGETRVKDVFIVSAPISGDLQRITFEAGDRVVSGETKLAAIDPTSAPILDQRREAQLQAAVQTARSAIGVAEADIERLRTDFNYAVSERDRLRPLLERDFISRSAFDKAEAVVNAAAAAQHSAESALGMRRSELQMARSALMPRVHKTSGTEHIDLKAGIDGVVLHIHRESEGPITQGAPIMEIGNPKDIEIVVDFLSEDAVIISPGDPVIISGWGGKDLMGRVRLIEPFAFTKISALGIEEQRVNVIIDFDETADSLGHGYRVDIAVVTWTEDDVSQVPMTALFKEGSDWKTYLVRNGKAELMTVEIGELNGRYAQILNGLSEGDRVIEHPSGRIENGRRAMDRSKN